MKVLVISHNPMNLEENNGRTIRNLFSDFEKGTVAQLFLHSGKIDAPFCENYYQITDFDVLNSIIKFRKPGKEVKASDTENEAPKENEIYGKYSHKTKYVRLVRDIAWGLGTWKTKEFKKWLLSFNPDVIFFYASDCVFSHSLVSWVRKFLDIPMVTYWVDDYYIKLKKSRNIADIINQKKYKRIVKKNFNNSLNVCITPAMAKAYAEIFGRKCFVLFNTTANKPFPDKQSCLPLVMSYLGNISIGRYNSIITIGKIISEKNLPIIFNVYSGEFREDILEKIRNGSGYVFHGKVNYEQVMDIMKDSDILVHVEGFEKENIEFCRYSLSTKIADSLMSNRCLLCYGPCEVASVDYLKSEECSLVATSEQELREALEKICEDYSELKLFAKKALRVAEQNHKISANNELIKKYLKTAIDSYKNNQE